MPLKPGAAQRVHGDGGRVARPMRPVCVSLKFATTYRARTGTMLISFTPGCT